MNYKRAKMLREKWAKLEKETKPVEETPKEQPKKKTKKK